MWAWLNTLQVSLLTDNGNTKDDLKLPTDENLLAQVCYCKVLL
jgi:Eukaryotic elongation factor 5A hypusine, DNA-binding OB fold